MKFGGTSVGDASCIARVAEIVAKASRVGELVVVVSAMSGVTNRLIEAATCSETGDRDRATELLEFLRQQHFEALKTLIQNPESRTAIALGIEELLREAQRLCEGTALIHELTVRTLDCVSSLGERLSAPIVAGALSERGVRSEAIEATELIVTDSYHGAAEPLMPPTRERCEARLPTDLSSQERVSMITFRFSTHCVAVTSRWQLGHLYSRPSALMTVPTHSVSATSSYITCPSASRPFSRAGTGTLSTSCASTRYRTPAHAVHCNRCSSANANVSVGSGSSLVSPTPVPAPLSRGFACA